MTSYYCELDSQSTNAIKKELSITKGVVRYVFFSMTSSDSFLSFAEINKQFEKKPLAEGEKKPEQMVRK